MPSSVLRLPPRVAYYPVLTGIRAIAAYIVFVHHYNPFTQDQGQLQNWGRFFVQQWHIGVPIFFVLSGFLIATRYRASVEPTGTWARRYFQNRFARIYPVYILLTALTFIGWQTAWLPELASANWDHYGLREKVTLLGLNVTLLRGYFSDYNLYGIGPAWTLTVEETFYLFCPGLLLLLRRRAWPVLVAPVAVLALGFLLVQVFTTVPGHTHLHGLLDSNHFMLNWTFFGRSTEFACGVGLALLVARYGHPAAPGWAWTAAGALGILLCVVALTQLEIGIERTAVGLSRYPSIVFNNVVLPLAVATLFWGLLHEQNLAQRVLASQAFDLLGKSSYAFYLLHGGFFSALVMAHVTQNRALYFLLTVAASIALYKWVEEPLHRRLRAKYVPVLN